MGQNASCSAGVGNLEMLNNKSAAVVLLHENMYTVTGIFEREIRDMFELLVVEYPRRFTVGGGWIAQPAWVDTSGSESTLMAAKAYASKAGVTTGLLRSLP